MCRCGEMVDAVDSKSTSSNRVLVRVRSPAKKAPFLGAFFLPVRKPPVWLSYRTRVDPGFFDRKNRNRSPARGSMRCNAAQRKGVPAVAVTHSRGKGESLSLTFHPVLRREVHQRLRFKTINKIPTTIVTIPKR